MVSIDPRCRQQIRGLVHRTIAQKALYAHHLEMAAFTWLLRVLPLREIVIYASFLMRQLIRAMWRSCRHSAVRYGTRAISGAWGRWRHPRGQWVSWMRFVSEDRHLPRFLEGFAVRRLLRYKLELWYCSRTLNSFKAVHSTVNLSVKGFCGSSSCRSMIWVTLYWFPWISWNELYLASVSWACWKKDIDTSSWFLSMGGRTIFICTLEGEYASWASYCDKALAIL